MCMMEDFHIDHLSPVVIYCDNKSTFHISANHVSHEITKHIKIGCHVVRDKIQVETIHLILSISKEQVTNIMIKSLHT